VSGNKSNRRCTKTSSRKSTKCYWEKFIKFLKTGKVHFVEGGSPNYPLYFMCPVKSQTSNPRLLQKMASWFANLYATSQSWKIRTKMWSIKTYYKALIIGPVWARHKGQLLGIGSRTRHHSAANAVGRVVFCKWGQVHLCADIYWGLEPFCKCPSGKALPPSMRTH
jgi:hypothetical protein